MTIHLKTLLKRLMTVIGSFITLLITVKPILYGYNKFYEYSPYFLVRFFVKYVRLPRYDNVWTIRLVNGKTIKTIVRISDIKSQEFALSYKWHSPALNFTEKILCEYSSKKAAWIDIGANLGIRSLLALSEGKSVYMIEPNNELNKLNFERCNFNKFENYKIIEIGISDKKSMASFYIDNSSYNSSLNSKHFDISTLNKTIDIRLDSLDNLFLNNISEKPSCIKIDVEGHEIAVLNGGKLFIERWSPPMIIEVNENSHNFNRFYHLVSLWGYTIYQIKEYAPKKYFKSYTLGSPIETNDFLVVKDAKLTQILQRYTIV